MNNHLEAIISSEIALEASFVVDDDVEALFWRMRRWCRHPEGRELLDKVASQHQWYGI